MLEQLQQILTESGDECGSIYDIFVGARRLKPNNYIELNEIVATLITLICSNDYEGIRMAMALIMTSVGQNMFIAINPPTEDMLEGYQYLMDKLILELDAKEQGNIMEYIGAIKVYADCFT